MFLLHIDFSPIFCHDLDAESPIQVNKDSNRHAEGLANFIKMCHGIVSLIFASYVSFNVECQLSICFCT